MKILSEIFVGFKIKHYLCTALNEMLVVQNKTERKFG